MRPKAEFIMYVAVLFLKNPDFTVVFSADLHDLAPAQSHSAFDIMCTGSVMCTRGTC
jgi:hypothetical protein